MRFGSDWKKLHHDMVILENVKASYSHQMLYLPSLSTLVLQNSCLLKLAALF